jgi:hypothetical protein
MYSNGLDKDGPDYKALEESSSTSEPKYCCCLFSSAVKADQDRSDAHSDRSNSMNSTGSSNSSRRSFIANDSLSGMRGGQSQRNRHRRAKDPARLAARRAIMESANAKIVPSTGITPEKPRTVVIDAPPTEQRKTWRHESRAALEEAPGP